MSEKISEQISEQTAREILKIAYYTLGMADAINTLRDKGYIKQSKLEEVRAWCEEQRDKANDHCVPYCESYRTGIMDTQRGYEAAIAEILEEKQS